LIIKQGYIEIDRIAFKFSTVQKDKVLTHSSNSHYYDLWVILKKEERTGDAILTRPIAMNSLFIGRSVIIKKKQKKSNVTENPVAIYP
jgi:hypothetical protein